ncbi:phosphoserine aminotransferase [Janthinobacterium sp. Marseille]|uniref:Phosphoserine aminotransferase n=1 Tax=Janthinobacterium sp. (strain Marseille) TaxID=375286 RepID=SERC_JANMA|nr:3-phosphoserine/phosphohydroxythreonine transaminase [Janthinobacterium sp. Marseille]A6T1G7.1 RecName: Full=Phosphoserine aminotransferase; AltName: Full=Phosphohydroxythreonine aminotransferase; Short=PSAT [Janthinobacterium sp. Marseille]ABR89236.1 phosphoserine aminotransferase [Janthinobacterium sp. Marseille]
MKRVYNFSPGPAALPQEVIKQAAEEMTNWRGSGLSVMEMSHRGREFTEILATTKADLRSLLSIPDNYKILLMQGGAIAENAIVPMNLVGSKAQPATIDFVNTGHWSSKTIEEAHKYAKVNIAASSEDKDFTYVPARDTWKLTPDAAYVHICTNETIGGVEFDFTPDVGNVPLVADMSSNILSREIDISKYAVIYAGAQKNIGPAGVTIVIVRDDMLGHALPICPSAFDWKLVDEHDSMFNTPPTYPIYIAGLTFQWMLRQGGVAAMEQVNIAKAKLIYDYLDSTDFYVNSVPAANRSRMNVPFFLKDESLNGKFITEADAQGLVQLKGHSSVGGMRASIYNAMPIEGVQALVAFMKDFEKKYG